MFLWATCCPKSEDWRSLEGRCYIKFRHDPRTVGGQTNGPDLINAKCRMHVHHRERDDLWCDDGWMDDLR